MKARLLVPLAAASLAGLSVFAADNNPTVVDTRQATMKGVALAMKTATRFTSPKFPFDPPKVKDLMGSVAASANTLHGLYPPTSAADLKSAADPKIWRNRTDFDNRLTEMERLATAASNATTTEAFKPALSTLAATCKSCHDVYRKQTAN